MRAGDLAIVAALSGQLGYPASEHDVARRFEELHDHQDSRLLVAEAGESEADAGAVLGWIHVRVHRSLESDSTGEVLGLIVREGARGRGIGAALLGEAERWAAGRGCRRLRVRSNVVRERAHRFYRREGYGIVKTQAVLEKALLLLLLATLGLAPAATAGCQRGPTRLYWAQTSRGGAVW